MVGKKYKIFFVFLFCAIFSLKIYAQISVNPSHSFYYDAQRWESYGYIDHLPPIRPYPINIIKEILNKVVECNDFLESEKAEIYLEELTGKPVNIYLNMGFDYKRSDTNNFAFTIYPDIHGNVSLLNDFIGIGYKIGFSGYTEPVKNYIKDFLPSYYNPTHDIFQTPARMWKMNFYLDANDTVSIGNKNYFVQFGLSRIGFGNYINEGLALNDSSYHSANIVFTVLQNHWSYSQLYATLGATKSFDGSGELLGKKFLAFHQFQFKIKNILSFSLYEDVVFGPNFNFSYMIPAPYIGIQELGGCNDNIQMGFLINYTPVSGLMWNSDFCLDDINFNEIVKFNFDTKIRLAATTGIVYYPKTPVISNLAAKYTFIFPYTYSHWEYEDDRTKEITSKTYNYTNYTNNGLPVGSSIPPNSDQIKFTIDFSPVKNLEMGVNLSFMRHANIAESLTTEEALLYLLAEKDTYSTDGSIYEHPLINGEPVLSSLYKLNFLTQKNKMLIFQGSLNAKYFIGNFNFGSISVKASYTAEYIRNKGVDQNIYYGGVEYKSEENKYIYEGISYTSKNDLISYMKNSWINSFKNEFNQYFYVGLEWTW